MNVINNYQKMIKLLQRILFMNYNNILVYYIYILGIKFCLKIKLKYCKIEKRKNQ